jgi:hypothetical protein
LPSGLAQLIEKPLEPRDGSLMTFHFAGPATLLGVVGELALKAEAVAQPGGVLGSGDGF